MTWEQLQKYLKGKVFLIGLTFIDQDQKLIEQYQTSGIVDELTNAGLFIFKRSDGSIFQLPYDKDTIKKAAKGDYRELETGKIIANPDFITTWEINIVDKSEIQKYKQNGFIPPS